MCSGVFPSRFTRCGQADKLSAVHCFAPHFQYCTGLRRDIFSPHQPASPTASPQGEADDPSVSRAADSSLCARKPRAVPFHSANSRGALPPLCKGRWVGDSRAGGIVPQATILSRLTPRYIPTSSVGFADSFPSKGKPRSLLLRKGAKGALALRGNIPVSSASTGRDTAMTVSAGAEVRLRKVSKKARSRRPRSLAGRKRWCPPRCRDRPF